MAPDPTASPEFDGFQQFVSQYADPVPVTAPLPDVFGPWVSIAVAATKAGLAAGRVIGGGTVVDLLVAITHIGDSQESLLASIKKDTTLLRQEPLKTAMTQMAEAQRVGPNNERFKGFVEDGIHNLYRANSLVTSLEELAIVQFCIACSYLILNAPSDARSWMNRSVESEREVLDALLRKRLGIREGVPANEVIDLRGKSEGEVLNALWTRSLGIQMPANIDLRGKSEREVLDALWTLWIQEDLPANEVPRPLVARPASLREALHELAEDNSLGTVKAGEALADLRIRRQRLARLDGFLQFVNMVELAADEASGRPSSVVLRLTPVICRGKSKRIRGEVFNQYSYLWCLREIPFDRGRLRE